MSRNKYLIKMFDKIKCFLLIVDFVKTALTFRIEALVEELKEMSMSADWSKIGLNVQLLFKMTCYRSDTISLK